VSRPRIDLIARASMGQRVVIGGYRRAARSALTMISLSARPGGAASIAWMSLAQLRRVRDAMDQILGDRP
jgi:hypothetical protein